MTGIIDYLPLLGRGTGDGGRGGGGGFPIGENRLTFPHLIITGDMSCPPPQNPDSAQINQPLIKGGRNELGWGGSLRELLHSCTEGLSTQILFNVLWNGKMFPAVVHSQVSRFYSRRLPLHPPPHLQRSSSQGLTDSPLTLPVMGPKGQLKL